MTAPMTAPPIAVTAAAGKTGLATVRELRARDLPVRALVRRRDARSQALQSLGAEVVEADERQLKLPSLAHPLNAMEGEAWKADHACSNGRRAATPHPARPVR